MPVFQKFVIGTSEKPDPDFEKEPLNQEGKIIVSENNKDHYFIEDEDGNKKKMLMTAKNVDIEHSGTKIIIPKGMPLREAKIWVNRKIDEENLVVSIDEPIEGYPLDAAYAFTKAMSKIYGWTHMIPIPGFFGDTPPTMVQLMINRTESVQVPWGRMEIPGVDGFIQSGITRKNGRFIFSLRGSVKNKDKIAVADLVAEAKKILNKDSIYRGKAICVKFPDEDDDDFNIHDCPSFLDVDTVNENELVFNNDLMQLVEANLFTPIEMTDEVRKRNIPLKRGVLLEGSHGTGKTLTAYIAAKKCVRNNWTFIYLEHTRDLASAIEFAKSYQPAMIFAEDIDSIMQNVDNTRDSRDEAVNHILNTIDGVSTKNTEIVVVLTTNYIDEVSQALLRPGRLDAVLSIEPPDPIAVDKLIRQYAGELLLDNMPLPRVSKRLQGQIPASIREVVERSKLIAIGRAQGDEFKLTDEDLDIAAIGMINHLELLKPKKEDKRTGVEKAADCLGTHLKTIAKMRSQIDNGNNGTKTLQHTADIESDTPQISDNT